MNERFKRLMLIESFWNFMYGLAAPFIAIYFNQFGGLEEVGISFAILSVFKGLMSFFAGKVLEKHTARTVLLFGQITESIRILLFIFASNIYFIYLLQFIGGITGGFISPSYFKLYVKVGKDEPGKSFGSSIALSNIAIGSSALISGLMLDYFGYAPMFIFWSIAELIYGLYIYFNV